jgi:ribosomal protein S18 acetylase RimI-like enzyme
VIVRAVRAEEAEAAGRVVVAAFDAVPGGHMSGGYADELADVAGRMTESEVLVALDAGRVVGCVTLAPDHHSALAEHAREGECQIRMMAVDPDCQGRGVGQLLLGAVLARARALGCDGVFLHSTPEMAAAHRLYQRHGFVRVPDRDWILDPDLTLIAFRLDLSGERP